MQASKACLHHTHPGTLQFRVIKRPGALGEKNSAPAIAGACADPIVPLASSTLYLRTTVATCKP